MNIPFSVYLPGMLLRFLSNGKYLRKNARKPISGVGGDYYLVNGKHSAQY